jgi:hypothetical protein
MKQRSLGLFSISERKKKDRLAPVSPKFDYVFWSNGQLTRHEAELL